jgi:hypothetical protein
MYASDNGDSLPTVYRTASSFTTYWLYDNNQWRNLGLLYTNGYVKAPETFYCLSGKARPNEVLAYNGPENEWTNGKVRSSFPARIQAKADGTVIKTAEAEWKLRDFTTKVVYSDFIGVTAFQGGGIVDGTIYAVHNGDGYNRLFGDSSVRWTRPGRLTSRISSSVPVDERQLLHYLELDTLP